jgi:hypothetical protein
MTVSDGMDDLATRAKQAQTRTAEAAAKARNDLEREVTSARDSAHARTEKLREKRQEGEAKASNRWADVQRSWDEHVAKARASVDDKRAEHDARSAQRRAEDAESYANFAIDLAYSSVVEAEYAALDAVLARMEADDAAAGREGVTGATS